MTTAFGRFELVRRLALGGMGEVFVAHSDGSGGLPRTLVIKRLLPHLVDDKEFFDLLLDEARIAARLVHPNVARVFELGDIDGRWYLAMEYVPGWDLRAVLDRAKEKGRRLSALEAGRIAAQAAAGLDHAHHATDESGRELKVVHLDVSPQNLLLSATGQVKVIDFGIARAASRVKVNREEVLRGKYPYMSPEQAAGDGVDHRSDQFSLAAVLWEALAGRRLFESEAPAKTLEQVMRCEVRAPSGAAGGVSPSLDAVVLRALSKSAADRFADTGAFRQALEDALGGPAAGADEGALLSLVQQLFPEGPQVLEALPPTASPPTPRRATERVSRAFVALSPAARAALAQLALFPKDFSVEAAEAVVDVRFVPDAPWVLDLLQSLKDAGFVESVASPAGSGELRFAVAAAARSLADELLAETPEAIRTAAVARLARRGGGSTA